LIAGLAVIAACGYTASLGPPNDKAADSDPSRHLIPGHAGGYSGHAGRVKQRWGGHVVRAHVLPVGAGRGNSVWVRGPGGRSDSGVRWTNSRQDWLGRGYGLNYSKRNDRCAQRRQGRIATASPLLRSARQAVPLSALRIRNGGGVSAPELPAENPCDEFCSTTAFCRFDRILTPGRVGTQCPRVFHSASFGISAWARGAHPTNNSNACSPSLQVRRFPICNVRKTQCETRVDAVFFSKLSALHHVAHPRRRSASFASASGNFLCFHSVTAQSFPVAELGCLNR
jgi:hypothetical protein